MKLAELTWPELRDRAQDALAVFPIASCEQHSHHLPFFTDSLLVTAVAEELERRRPQEVLLTPTQWLGASLHHMPFAGTLSACAETHMGLILDTVESLIQAGLERILLLNGHGGNEDPMQLALRELKPVHPDILLAAASYWHVAAPEIAAILEGPRKGVGHACEMETAMMLALYPELVRTEAIEDDVKEGDPALRGVFLNLDFAERTHHGGMGYAALATAEKGQRLFQAIVDRLEEVVTALWGWEE